MESLTKPLSIVFGFADNKTLPSVHIGDGLSPAQVAAAAEILRAEAAFQLGMAVVARHQQRAADDPAAKLYVPTGATQKPGR